MSARIIGRALLISLMAVMILPLLPEKLRITVEATPPGVGQERGPVRPVRVTKNSPAQGAYRPIADVFPSLTQPVFDWASFNPAVLTVCPFPGYEICFQRFSTRNECSLGGPYLTWTGHSGAMPGASLVTVAKASGFDAILVVPGNPELNFHVSASGAKAGWVSTVKIDSTRAGCGVGDLKRSDPGPEPTAASFAANYAAVAKYMSASSTTVAPAQELPSVDLLYAFMPDFVEQPRLKDAGGDPVLVLDGQLAVVTATMNEFLRQSGVATFRINYIGAVPTPIFNRSGRLADDISAASNPNSPLSGALTGFRRTYGADSICLLVSTSADYGGIANMIPQVAYDKWGNHFVVANGNGWGPAGAGGTVSAMVAAHEFGHTLGCHHDRKTARIYSDQLYCYGWMQAGTANTGTKNDIGTIMSYAGMRIPYYSNPDLTVRVSQELAVPQLSSQPIGSWGNPDYGAHRIGVPIGEVNPLNNAKVMADNGPLVAGFFAPASSVRIEEVSTDTQITEGAELNLAVKATGLEVRYQWFKDDAPLAGATLATYTKLQAFSADEGVYTVKVANYAFSTSASIKVTVMHDPALLAITAAPRSVTLMPNSGVTALTVEVSAHRPVSYQWTRDGVPIPGATVSTLLLSGSAAVRLGTYTCETSNGAVSAVTNPAVVSVGNAAAMSRIVNLSVLTNLAPNEGTFTVGTIVGGGTGNEPVALLGRAVGPTLATQPFGLNGVLSDPFLEFLMGAALYGANDNWGGDSIRLAPVFAAVGAFPLYHSGTKDAAVYFTKVAPGAYSMRLSSHVARGTGTTLVELYDATPNDSVRANSHRLVNVSVFKYIPSGEMLTVGFVIGGDAAKTVLVRAVGPTLASAPFKLTATMADPKLQLFSAGKVVGSNDNWGGSRPFTTAFAAAGAFALASATSRDAALLTTLPPGAYTVQITDAAGSGGRAIVEVYDLP